MKEAVKADPALMRECIDKFIPNADGEAKEKFVRFYEMLIDWNNRMNLTAITEPADIAMKHFADSLTASELIPMQAACIDIGTGAGFPGIPLKIMRPDIKLTLFDSLNKRIVFLNEVLSELDIQAETVHMRAEDGGRNVKFREKFDVALTRAVANTNVLCEWTLPFVKKGGVSIMYKGPKAADETEKAGRALKELNADASVKTFLTDWGERNLIIVRKNGSTPKKYPRKAGTAEKEPL